jgi:hypothetical protein
VAPQQGRIWALEGDGIAAVKVNAGNNLAARSDAQVDCLVGPSCLF